MNSIYSSNLRPFYLLMFFVFGCCLFSANAAPTDSIGVEYVDGQKVIIHKLTPKETYYGLGRRYQVPVKQIITANNNKALKVGDTLRIPVGDTPPAVASGNRVQRDTATGGQPAVPNLAPQDYTTYKVSRGETLAIISKRFMISVGTIKRANGLTDETELLEEGTLIKVPNKELPAVEPSTALSDIISDDSSSVASAPELPANRYGIREMTEKGIGVWIDDLNQVGGNMLALHKTAPVGTVVKITNPMTNRTTFAKVVGKFNDSAETKDAIIVISKSAANLIGVLDRRFQVEIAYGTPNVSED